MTTAAEILGMIDAVDPANKDSLDEISAHVWNYINPNRTTERLGGGFWSIKDGQYPYVPYNYSSSRDALKKIRPDCHSFMITKFGKSIGVDINLSGEKDKDGQYKFITGFGPTEELAELSAIISAIDHQRKNNGL